MSIPSKYLRNARPTTTAPASKPTAPVAATEPAITTTTEVPVTTTLGSIRRVARDGLTLLVEVERWYGEPVRSSRMDEVAITAADEADLHRVLMLLRPHGARPGELDDGEWFLSYEVVLVDSRGDNIVGIHDATEYLRARLERARERFEVN